MIGDRPLPAARLTAKKRDRRCCTYRLIAGAGPEAVGLPLPAISGKAVEATRFAPDESHPPAISSLQDLAVLHPIDHL
jgi:hypothetical protein